MYEYFFFRLMKVYVFPSGLTGKVNNRLRTCNDYTKIKKLMKKLHKLRNGLHT